MPKIEMDKKYRTGDGRPVRILCMDLKNRNYPVVVAVKEGAQEHVISYTPEGHCYADQVDADEDLVEISPFEGMEIDDKIWVRASSGGGWVPRHYAGNNGRSIDAWNDGKTSHSTDAKSPWIHFSKTNPI